MKRRRHTPEQIVRKLGEADAALSAGISLGQVCQQLARIIHEGFGSGFEGAFVRW
jgi:hypothetical protein